MPWYWPKKEVPVYRGYDITKDAFKDAYYVNGPIFTYGLDGRFKDEAAARAFMDTLPDLTQEATRS